MLEPFNISITEAAKALGCGRTSVYKCIQLGKLKTVRILGRHLVNYESVKALGGKLPDTKSA